MGINIFAEYLSHLRFADDIRIIAKSLNEANEGMEELRHAWTYIFK